MVSVKTLSPTLSRTTEKRATRQTKLDLLASGKNHSPTLTESDSTLPITTPTFQNNLIMILQVTEARAIQELDRLSFVLCRFIETTKLAFVLRVKLALRPDREGGCVAYFS